MDVLNTVNIAQDHLTGKCSQCHRPNTIVQPDGSTRMYTTCTDCGANVTVWRVYGTVNYHGCDWSCMYAIGRMCECSCGGQNHGIRWTPKTYGTVTAEELRQTTRKLTQIRDRAKKATDKARITKSANFIAWKACLSDDAWDAIDWLVNVPAQELNDAGNSILIEGATRLRKETILMEHHVQAIIDIRADMEKEARIKAERESAEKARRARAEAAGPIVTGRYEITGTVIRFYQREVQAGYYSTTQDRMILEDEHGRLYFLTVPAKMLDIAIEENSCTEDKFHGKKVTIRAAWAPFSDDETKGSGKRPHYVAQPDQKR